MIPKRIGLTAALLALASLSACTTWNDLADRITGDRGSVARNGSGAIPGASLAAGRETSMRGGPMNAQMPTFQTFNECRAWFAAQGPTRALNQGPWQGGEITAAGADPCQYYLSRS